MRYVNLVFFFFFTTLLPGLFVAGFSGGRRVRGTVRSAVGQRSRGLGVRPVRHPGFEKSTVFQAALGRRPFAAILAQRLLFANGWIRQQASAHRLTR